MHLMPFIRPPGLIASAAPGVILHDTFTPTGADVSLASVTPDTEGDGYTLAGDSNATVDIERADSAEYSNGVARPSADELNLRIAYYSDPVPPSANYKVEATIETVGTGTNRLFHLMARMSGGTGYALSLLGTQFNLYRLDGLSSRTSLGLDFADPVAGDTFRLTVDGSTISVDKRPDGGSFSEEFSVTDSTYSAAGDAGIGWGAWGVSEGDIEETWRINELLIEEV